MFFFYSGVSGLDIRIVGVVRVLRYRFTERYGS